MAPIRYSAWLRIPDAATATARAPPQRRRAPRDSSRSRKSAAAATMKVAAETGIIGAAAPIWPRHALRSIHQPQRTTSAARGAVADAADGTTRQIRW